jgi:hypothetical protein
VLSDVVIEGAKDFDPEDAPRLSQAEAKSVAALIADVSTGWDPNANWAWTSAWGEWLAHVCKHGFSGDMNTLVSAAKAAPKAAQQQMAWWVDQCQRYGLAMRVYAKGKGERPDRPAPWEPAKISTPLVKHWAETRGNSLKGYDLSTMEVARFLTENAEVLSEYDGKYAIRCPWEDEHSGPSGESTTVVLWAGPGHVPGFKCLRSCHSGRKITDYLQEYSNVLGNYCQPMADAKSKEEITQEIKDKAASLNDRYTYLYQRDEVWDNQHHLFIPVKGFRQLGSAEQFWMSPDNADERNKRANVRFDPNMPESTVFLNLYDPLVILQPTARTWSEMSADPRADLFRRLIHSVVGGVRDDVHYVVKLLAYMLKYPGRKCCALIVRGEYGTGKGLLARTLKAIFRKYAVTVTSDMMASNFNAWMWDCVIGLANEIEEGNVDHRKQAAVESRMKMWITDEEIVIEGKFKDVQQTKNFSKWVIFANDFIPVRVKPGDRRYSVVSSPTKMNESDPGLGADLDNVIRNDPDWGRFVADFLYSVDLSGFNALEPHQNKVRNMLIADGLTSSQRWWQTELPPPGTFPHNVIYDAYTAWCAAEKLPLSPLRTLMLSRPQWATSDRIEKKKLAPHLQKHVKGRMASVYIIPDKGQGGLEAHWPPLATDDDHSDVQGLISHLEATALN